MNNYKLIIHPVVETSPNTFTSFEFETLPEAKAASYACADLLLFLQDKAGVMRDEANMFVLCELIDGEWGAVEDDYVCENCGGRGWFANCEKCIPF
jgi:hypothetical protein